MKRSIGPRLARALSLCVLMVIMSGCTFGLRKETKIVYGNVAPVTGGAVRVATNDPIQVTVGVEASTMDLGGYYLVSPMDMKLIVRLLREEAANADD